jgi:hypothetical protein
MLLKCATWVWFHVAARMRFFTFFLIIMAAMVTLSHSEAFASKLGQACGGADAAVCDKGLWCEPAAGLCAGGSGICVQVPKFCVSRKKTNSFRPVCGCNNKTYSNDCFRRAYRVPKSHDGKC